MNHIYTITKADVGDGVYRHPFGSKMRSLLVSIKGEFGGIGPKDVGVKIYRSKDGKLVWGPVIGQKRIKSNPRRKSKRRVRKNSGSSKRSLLAKSIARRLKIYGGARLRKYGSKIVKRNRGCGCRRSK